MPRGDKSDYTAKQKRRSSQIEETSGFKPLEPKKSKNWDMNKETNRGKKQ